MNAEPTLAEQIFEAVFAELYDRKGFDGWWDGIDGETCDEIKRECIAVIEAQIEGNYPDEGEVYGYPNERGRA